MHLTQVPQNMVMLGQIMDSNNAGGGGGGAGGAGIWC